MIARCLTKFYPKRFIIIFIIAVVDDVIAAVLKARQKKYLKHHNGVWEYYCSSELNRTLKIRPFLYLILPLGWTAPSLTPQPPPRQGTEEHPGSWPCHDSPNTNRHFHLLAPGNADRKLSSLGSWRTLPGLRPCISFPSGGEPPMPADRTQRKISPGGISRTKPPTSLMLQEWSVSWAFFPLSWWFTAAGAHENLIGPVWGRNSHIPPLSPGWIPQPFESSPVCLFPAGGIAHCAWPDPLLCRQHRRILTRCCTWPLSLRVTYPISSSQQPSEAGNALISILQLKKKKKMGLK